MAKMEFENPKLQLYCEKCGTSNYYYTGEWAPYYCNECGKWLDPFTTKIERRAEEL